MKSLILFSLMILLVSCSSNNQPCESCQGSLKDELVQLFILLNEARAEGQICGGVYMPAVPALKLDVKLITAAQKHSEDMRITSVMSHDTPKGAKYYPAGTPFDKRITKEGYQYSSASENVAAGYPSASSVMVAWLESTGHCQNIMSSNVTEVGLGHDGGYWTQDFASPLNP